MKLVIAYVGAIRKATVGHRYQYGRIAFTYCTYVIDERFCYMTGVKVLYLHKLWLKSVIDYVGAIRKATVRNRFCSQQA